MIDVSQKALTHQKTALSGRLDPVGKNLCRGAKVRQRPHQESVRNSLLLDEDQSTIYVMCASIDIPSSFPALMAVARLNISICPDDALIRICATGL